MPLIVQQNLFVLILCLIVLLDRLTQSHGSIQSITDDKSTLKCALCNEIVDEIFKGFNNGMTDREISFLIGQRCETLNIFNFKLCNGTASIIMPTIRYMHTNQLLIQGNLCGIYLQADNCSLSDPDNLEWNITSSSVSKPPIAPFVLPSVESPTIKVLHLADLHWDPDYVVGSNAVCKELVCCRADSEDLLNQTDAAGYWGDYRSCDLPWYTIEKAVAHMAEKHSDAAYIIWTGDLAPHNVWSTNKEENIYVIERLMNLIQQYFPKTPVYATLGNHEAHPSDTFAPPEITDEEFNTAWLYDVAARQWARWLPAEVASTIRYGGYYTAVILPGLRVISLNTNYCYTGNWWTLSKSQDPASSLLWLNKVLEDAERAGEKVHILSHIPPGNGDCWTIFSREFSKIINRFESTVAAQFYGHTHKDEFKIFYDLVDRNRPTNVAFIGPSLTPFTELNPGYRVYTIDGSRPGSTWAVLDFATWAMNLTAANLLGPSVDPVWFELYQMKQEYQLDDLSPNGMSVFFRRMLVDDALFQRYFQNYYRNSDRRVPQGCDDDCRLRLLCFTVTTDIADQSRCAQIAKQILKHDEF
ncbi:sphingomyelin phosphodiesterase-like [Daphnia pulicaria]|uniref:sphingomyelin phosphodiesterase-like n=1 Tax=Daphnia pulicaria TaxID=35523 RepID=UPI001EE9D611|nr:sphingomyelin phosphodiesterase-like [Daphnia pulicaria]